MVQEISVLVSPYEILGEPPYAIDPSAIHQVMNLAKANGVHMLLPKLRCLWYSSSFGGDQSIFGALISPHLQGVIISTCPNSMAGVFQVLTPLMVCKHLRYLSWCTTSELSRVPWTLIQPTLLGTLHWLRHLERVMLPESVVVDPTVWAMLSSLPTLKSLTVGRDIGDRPRLSNVGLSPGFAALTSIEVPVDITDLARFFSTWARDRPPPWITAHVAGSVTSLRDVLHDVGTSCTSLTAVDLLFSHLSVRWGMAELRELFPLSSLSSLRVRTNRSADIDDRDYFTIAEAFPHIKSLSISKDPIDETRGPPPRVTLGALLGLAKYCTHLEHLEIYLNGASSTVYPPSLSHYTFQKLRRIDFGLSPLEGRQIKITLGLAHLLPVNTALCMGYGENPTRLSNEIKVEDRDRMWNMFEQWRAVGEDVKWHHLYLGPMKQGLRRLQQRAEGV